MQLRPLDQPHDRVHAAAQEDLEDVRDLVAVHDVRVDQLVLGRRWYG